MNNLNILYEDNHLVVVEKKAGVLSQGDISSDENLLDMVKSYIKEKYNKPGEAFIGLVHRLDRNTSGIMVFARTSKAASRLSLDILEHRFKKSYYAVIEGELLGDGHLVDYISKNEDKKIAYINKDGKKAELNYHVLETVNNLTLVDVELLTGRFHQIRIQFASRNYPLYGDSKYGSKISGNELGLCCYKLGFYHPISKEYMEFTIEPKDGIFKKFLKFTKSI